MCILCIQGNPQDHTGSPSGSQLGPRDVLKASPTPSSTPTYFVSIPLTVAPVYRPEDVYISDLFGGLAKLDDGVTTVREVSQIHRSARHSDAAIQALFDTGRRAAFGFFESAGN